MSGFQSAVSIQQVIDKITRNEYLLPAFQREFEWQEDRIAKLFDSLMKGYPIGSLLFWKVKGTTKTDFKFYEFLKICIEDFQTQAGLVPTSGSNEFHSVLDGQQRLTALYIGLKGSYASHEHNKRYENNERSYPTRHLYLNVSSYFTEEESDMKYKFYFAKKIDTGEKELFVDKNNEKWFKVGHILTLHSQELGIDDFIKEKELDREAQIIIRKLDNVIHNTTPINYYEEEDQNPDKAVNIFVRINSGGKPLSLFTNLTFQLRSQAGRKMQKLKSRI